jgi:nitrogen fixation/metabolism regulation signal transduction histidine kinase
MAFAAIKKLFSGVQPIVALFVLLLASLALMSDATHSSTQFGRLYTVLLIINALAILLLVGLIIKNLYLLMTGVRNQVTGAKLTARLVILFVVLSVTPVSVVYYFSLDFLQRGIDSWFDVRVETSLNDALELSQASLGARMRDLLRQTHQISTELSSIPDDLVSLSLNAMRENLDAAELTLFSQSGRIIASNSAESTKLVPVRLDETVQARLRQESEYFGLIPLPDSGLSIRVAVLVPSADPMGEARILQALFSISDRINTLANNVQQAFTQYRELVYLRKPLKVTFILTLSLVLLLTLLMAIWAAFFFARRLVQPISDLVVGTQAVAAGNYQTQLPTPGRDELGFLVRSFNTMTQKIAMVTDEANRSQRQLAEQHAYLEVVLAHLSSGVITLDMERRLHTSNAAASHILGVNLDAYEGFSLDKMSHEHPQTLLFVDMIYSHLDNQNAEWREEMTLFNTTGRQVLLCRGSPLPASNEKDPASGYIILFDDITNLVQAQRNAAWGEVARRLAHEIKNPLTPIQLSAERLRHKYLGKMSPADAELLDRSTHTIVQQVETLKEMVKAFSDYARMPNLELKPTDLNIVIEEVLDLYRHENSSCRFEVQFDPNAPIIEADDGRLRQLLHNLIKNSLEAMGEQTNAVLRITTQCMEKEACKFVEIRIADNGPGIPEDVIGQLFEPYVTTKPKGSGLGLAIVKKIIEEHGGMIWAENNETGGARIVIRLPVNKQDQQALAPAMKAPAKSDSGKSDAAA